MAHLNSYSYNRTDYYSQKGEHCDDLTKDTTTFMGHMKKAAHLGCRSCGLLLKAINHFNLTKGLTGEVTGAGSQEWEYEKENGDRCYFLTKDSIAVIIIVQPTNQEKNTPARLLFYLCGTKFSDYVQLYVKNGKSMRFQLITYLFLI